MVACLLRLAAYTMNFCVQVCLCIWHGACMQVYGIIGYQPRAITVTRTEQGITLKQFLVTTQQDQVGGVHASCRPYAKPE